MTVKEALQAGADALDAMGNCCGCSAGSERFREAVESAGFRLSEYPESERSIVVGIDTSSRDVTEHIIDSHGQCSTCGGTCDVVRLVQVARSI